MGVLCLLKGGSSSEVDDVTKECSVKSALGGVLKESSVKSTVDDVRLVSSEYKIKVLKDAVKNYFFLNLIALISFIAF